MRLTVHRTNGTSTRRSPRRPATRCWRARRSLEKELRGQIKHGGTRKAAEIVGQRIAAKAKEKGIEKVAFDRAGYRYHGRVKALADAARAGGLKF